MCMESKFFNQRQQDSGFEIPSKTFTASATTSALTSLAPISTTGTHLQLSTTIILSVLKLPNWRLEIWQMLSIWIHKFIKFVHISPRRYLQRNRDAIMASNVELTVAQSYRNIDSIVRSDSEDSSGAEKCFSILVETGVYSPDDEVDEQVIRIYVVFSWNCLSRSSSFGIPARKGSGPRHNRLDCTQ